MKLNTCTVILTTKPTLGNTIYLNRAIELPEHQTEHLKLHNPGSILPLSCFCNFVICIREEKPLTFLVLL